MYSNNKKQMQLHELSKNLCITESSGIIFEYLKDHISFFGDDTGAISAAGLASVINGGLFLFSGRVKKAGVKLSVFSLFSLGTDLVVPHFSVVSITKKGIFRYEIILSFNLEADGELNEAEFYGASDLAHLFDYILLKISPSSLMWVFRKEIIRKMTTITLE